MGCYRAGVWMTGTDLNRSLTLLLRIRVVKPSYNGPGEARINNV